MTGKGEGEFRAGYIHSHISIGHSVNGVHVFKCTENNKLQDSMNHLSSIKCPQMLQHMKSLEGLCIRMPACLSGSLDLSLSLSIQLEIPPMSDRWMVGWDG